MKNILSALALFIISGIAIAQSQPTVTIHTTGNRNKQIIVDGREYTINNIIASDEKEIVINDLMVGTHTLEVVRTNQNNLNTSVKSTFTLREQYDLLITVSSNGSISLAESRIGRGQNSGRQLSPAAFTRLQSQTKSRTGSVARAAFLENEFNNSNRRMTSSQASKLIQLVNSESLRLKLAKQSYKIISDPENFSLVSNLLNSTRNRNELNEYVALAGHDGTDEQTQMSNAQFDVVFQEVMAEPTSAEKVYYLNNFFSRDFNYYSAAQARRLIEAVSGENNRLELAKNAYRGVVDRENFSTVYTLLSNPASRSQLVAYINTYNNNNPSAAMTAVNFDRLYQTIYRLNSSSSRYSSINTAFSTPGNYFTVGQAKKLIPLVSDQYSRLQLSKTSYKVLVDRSNASQFNEFLTSSSYRNEFANYVANFNASSTGGNIAMDDATYNTLYNSVRNAWNSATKYNLVSDAFKSTTNYFTTYQVRQLLTQISSETDRLPLAKNAYNNVVDPENYSQLYDLFSSTSNRNDLANYVSIMQSGTGTIAKIPMSESEFNSLYSKIQLTFGLGAKYSRLTELFNTETNYFTSAQTKKLILLLSSESNKLELAKLSYDNVTDPANFSQLYDMFSQANRNELINYVNSSAYNN